MAFNLRNRSFLTLSDFNKREMEYMLDLAEDLKKAKYAGTEGKNLEGKNIALIFEKMTAVLAGMVLYITYVCFQIPAYYKFGPIKGRVFMYVPVVGILLTMFVVEKADIRTGVLFRMLSENRYLGPCLLVLYLAAVVCISIGISVRISKNKEW